MLISRPTKQSTSVFSTIVTVSAAACLSLGCGAPTEPTKSSSPASTVPSATSATPTPNEKTEDQSKLPSNPNVANSTESLAEVDVSSFEEKSENQQSTKQVSPIEPATNKHTLALIKLLELPRFGEGNALQSGQTYLYYSCKGSLPEVDLFYKEKLAALEWKELPSSTPVTEHYIDRLYTKNGFYLRASLSVGSQPDELGIMLSSLGNVDMRLLPTLSDAEIMSPATPISVTYQTQMSIPDATEEIRKKLVEQGWQPWMEFQENPISVPHYRDLHFRKEACRLLVGIVKNPQNPSDKTSVSYIAEYVNPFDVPMLPDAQTLKLDLYTNRASFDATSSRGDLVKLLQANSDRYGWTISNAEKFESGDEHMIPIQVDTGAYLVARLVESAGRYSTSIESFASPPKKQSSMTQPTKVDTPPLQVSEKLAMDDSTFKEIESDINAAIQTEVAKAIGSLNNPADRTAMNVADLEAKAKELQSMFAKEKAADHPDEDSTLKGNPFDVAEDADAPSSEIQSIKESVCKVTFDNTVLELRHVACYVINEYGEPTKCILFSDQPIDQKKLQQQLLESGESVYGMEVSPSATNMVDFRIKKESVSLNAKLDSSSMGASTSKIKTNVSYYQSKLMGKIETSEALSIGERSLTLVAQLNQSIITVDWTKRSDISKEEESKK